MNWWWLIMIPIGCLWVIPMLGASAAGMPWWFFAAFALFWTVMAIFMEPLYDFGTTLFRKIHFDSMADFRERIRPGILPPTRAALLIMAATSVLAAFL